MSSFNTPDESVQDTVAQLINQAANTDVVYNDANDTLTVSLTDSVSVNTLEATDSITGPEGNIVTDLSDPVRVTEEASTFSESNVSINQNKTKISSGSIILKNEGSTATRPSDDNSENIESGKGLIINPNTSLSGVKVVVSQNTGNVSTVFLSQNDNTILDEKTTGFSAGDIVELNADLQSNTEYTVGVYDSGNTYTLGFSQTVSFPFTSADIDITNGTFSAHPNDGFSQGTTDDAFGISDVTGIVNANSGDALVSFDSGAPADIDSYDLATFQRTLDGETVTVDVEDSTGTVLKSDISKDTDISDIATSKDVQLRANLSRNDTANNPTVDYLARRFTR